eukprot:Gregarina_sp_Pseudo_9__937@NODE_159_length_3916_cov_23_910498_g146_i0_p2_GENE_NODE_159_length_3916_cov_23_910498_g146_i0NODE_159_length_3916_cov_23_910498_g146_i0_p2_ORF_typecomplete_len308_score88_90Branch/PF02485_21/1_7e08_NODE_159_length_3916_cov_23_910498_g146_i011022025
MLSRVCALLWLASAQPHLVVMFLAAGGVRHAHLWSQWAAHTQARISGVLLSTSPASVAAVPDFVSRVIHPPETDPLRCRWGRLLRCTAMLFEAAFNETAGSDETWFLLMSAQSVPLKSADTVARALETRPHQTWAPGLTRGFWHGCPKTSQWLIFPGDHLRALLKFRDYWTADHWIRVEDPEVRNVAAGDETLPACMLARTLGDAALHAGSVISADDRVNKQWLHYVCWSNCTRVGRTTGRSRPANWVIIYKHVLDALLAEPTLFFARKFESNALVLDAYTGFYTPLAHYLSTALGFDTDTKKLIDG